MGRGFQSKKAKEDHGGGLGSESSKKEVYHLKEGGSAGI